jgi:putative intracellular protease/amidase
MNRGKILVALSSFDHILLEGGKRVETGFFLKEVMLPLQKVLDSGYDVVFANPKGNTPHMDPLSDKYVWYMGNVFEYRREKECLERMQREKMFDHPRSFKSFSDNELNEFSGLFIPGGHAPMMDLPDDVDLGRIICHFHHAGKPIGSICHGPIAFLSTLKVETPFIFSGYKMTCYSNAEERMMEMMWRDKVAGKAEDRLRDVGGVMEEAMPMLRQVTIDHELITAQNPSSANWFGDEFLSALQDYNIISPT